MRKVLFSLFFALILGMFFMPEIQDIAQLQYFKFKYPTMIARGQILEMVEPQLKERMTLGGSHGLVLCGVAGGSFNWEYCSWYNREEDEIYYKFASLGDPRFEIRSDLFLYLLGKHNLQLAPGDAIYIMLSNPAKPVSERTNIPCRLSKDLGGGALELFLLTLGDRLNWGWNFKMGLFIPSDFEKMIKQRLGDKP